MLARTRWAITTRVRGPESQPLSSDRERRLAAPVPALSSRYVPDRMAVDRTLAQAAAPSCRADRGVATSPRAASPHEAPAAACPGQTPNPPRRAGSRLPAQPLLCLINAERRTRRAADSFARAGDFQRRHVATRATWPASHYFSHTSPGWHDLPRADPAHGLPARRRMTGSSARTWPGARGPKGDSPRGIAGVDDQSRATGGFFLARSFRKRGARGWNWGSRIGNLRVEPRTQSTSV